MVIVITTPKSPSPSTTGGTSGPGWQLRYVVIVIYTDLLFIEELTPSHTNYLLYSTIIAFVGHKLPSWTITVNTNIKMSKYICRNLSVTKPQSFDWCFVRGQAFQKYKIKPDTMENQSNSNNNKSIRNNSMFSTTT